jgi:hypothetical protein
MAAEAWWIYCVVPRSRTLPEGLVGLAGGTPERVEAGELAAVASPVPLDEYGEEPLRRNLNDLDWLERMARTHETVIERMLGGGEVVPVRVCTIYSSREQVSAMLEERADTLGATLGRLAQRSEWGVKVLLERPKLEARAVSEVGLTETDGSAAKPNAGGAGAAYIARKRLATRVRDESERLLSEAVRDVHGLLAESASDAAVLPAQNRELSGYTGEMVLNGAYLVSEAGRDAFASLVHELDVRYDELGLKFELTGPWPPYNFVAVAA